MGDRRTCKPASRRFPARNRLIAALADAVLVVEARARSGALITADHALDLGRDVLAVPGWAGAPAAAGANGLRKAGAGMIVEGERYDRRRNTYIYVNNRLEGNALETISAMIEMIEVRVGSIR